MESSHSLKVHYIWIMVVKFLYSKSSFPCITIYNIPQMSTIWAIKLYEWTSYKSFGSNFNFIPIVDTQFSTGDVARW